MHTVAGLLCMMLGNRTDLSFNVYLRQRPFFFLIVDFRGFMTSSSMLGISQPSQRIYSLNQIVIRGNVLYSPMPRGIFWTLAKKSGIILGPRSLSPLSFSDQNFPGTRNLLQLDARRIMTFLICAHELGASLAISRFEETTKWVSSKRSLVRILLLGKKNIPKQFASKCRIISRHSDHPIISRLRKILDKPSKKRRG